MSVSRLLVAVLLVSPLAAAGETSIEGRHLVKPNAASRHPLPVEPTLPSLGPGKTWLNSPPLGPSDLRGKVVLVDIWNYSCINWIRQVPYVRAWAERYKDHGLMVIGVHSPEFGFETGLENVRRAAKAFGVTYPIVLDSDHAIWDALENEAWPALYFVDAQGRIRHRYYGEGRYDAAERIVQQLLAEAGQVAAPQGVLSVDARGVEAAADWGSLRSPETYLGLARTTGFASPGGPKAGHPHAYAAPARLGLNQWAIAGDWTMGREATLLNAPDGRITLRFHARDLHLVMGPSASGARVRFRVLLDGRPPGPAKGLDVDSQGNGVVTEPRLYQLIRQPGPITDRTFEIEFLDAGAETFSFTFG